MSAKGWECPKCGCVYAPWMVACARCNKRPVAFPRSPAIQAKQFTVRGALYGHGFRDGCT